MSIDCYPYYDLSQDLPNVTEEVGAASLLYRNVLAVWPEFEGNDLTSSHPDMKFCNLAEDGATTFDFLDDSYLQLLKGKEKLPSIVTVTLGGNDLLRILTAGSINIADESANVALRYNQVIDILCTALPRAICILSTIYDPTDGSGVLQGFGDISAQLPWLHFINDAIEKCARKHSALFADVHKHFLGHGLSAPKAERWYWDPSPIEPGARGASELRRLWYDLLAAENLV